MTATSSVSRDELDLAIRRIKASLSQTIGVSMNDSLSHLEERMTRVSQAFIFVQHLRGFLGQLCHLENCILSTPRQMPQTITNIPRCLPQILTVPKFWYHLAHSFSRKNVPFDFERAF